MVSACGAAGGASFTANGCEPGSGVCAVSSAAMASMQLILRINVTTTKNTIKSFLCIMVPYSFDENSVSTINLQV